MGNGMSRIVTLKKADVRLAMRLIEVLQLYEESAIECRSPTNGDARDERIVAEARATNRKAEGLVRRLEKAMGEDKA